MKVYIAYTIADSTEEYLKKIETYAADLEAKGCEVFLRHRDCNMELDDLQIVMQVRRAIAGASEVHAFVPGDSGMSAMCEQAMDIGMVIQSGVPLKVVMYDEDGEEHSEFILQLSKSHARYFMTPAERKTAAVERIMGKIYKDVPEPRDFDPDTDNCN